MKGGIKTQTKIFRIVTLVLIALLFVAAYNVGEVQAQGYFFKLHVYVLEGVETHIKAMELLKEDLAKIGINLAIEQAGIELIFKTMYESKKTFDEGGWDMIFENQIEVTGGDPDLVAYSWFGSEMWPERGGMNVVRWSNPIASDLALRAGSTYDRDARKELYSEWLRIFYDEMPLSPVYGRTFIYVGSSKLEGFDDYIKAAKWIAHNGGFTPLYCSAQISGGTSKPDTVIMANRYLSPNQINIFGRCYQFGSSFGLVRPNEEGEPVPALAKSWEISEDGLTITFSLLTNVKWDDGVPFTSKDVKYTFETIMNPDVPARHNKACTDIIKSIETPDDYTVVFHLKKISPGFLPLLVDPYLCMIPEHVLSKIPPKDLLTSEWNTKKMPPGLAQWSWSDMVEGEYHHWVANPYCPPELGGPPKLKHLYMKLIPDRTAAIAAVEAGEVDLLHSPYVPDDIIDELKANPKLQLDVVPQPIVFPLQYNNQHPILSNKYVRLAINSLIRREDIVSVILKGTAVATASPFPKTMWAYDKTIPEPKEYNLDLAKEYMAKAGYDLKLLEAAPTAMPWYYPLAAGLIVGIIAGASVSFIWRRKPE